MKKKILIILLIIILSFALGTAIHTVQVKRQYTTFIGAVEYIERNNVFIISEDETLKIIMNIFFLKLQKVPKTLGKSVIN